jgi:hypothetical protein
LPKLLSALLQKQISEEYPPPTRGAVSIGDVQRLALLPVQAEATARIDVSLGTIGRKSVGSFLSGDHMARASVNRYAVRDDPTIGASKADIDEEFAA